MRPSPLGDLRVAVTGATGWLGRAACEVLARTQAGDIAAFASQRRTLTLDAGPTLEVRPLAELGQTPHDILLHYAYVTRERIASYGLDAYVAANVAITAAVCDAIRAQRPRGILHASSGAAASAADELRADPYGVLKRLDEHTLRDAARDAGARCVTLRVYNVAGPWIVKRGFAIRDLIEQVASGGTVTVHAGHRVLRSYVDVEDLAELAVTVTVADGIDDDLRLDTAGEEVVEVGDLARRICAVLGRPDATIERDLPLEAPADHYTGDGARLHELAATLGITLRGLDEQIRRTGDYLMNLPDTK
jgi:nucleoside-diphosphate-sugar epimerase